MKELYGEGLATHADPESCVGSRKGAGEALTGAHAGRAIEPRNSYFWVPTPLQRAEGNTILRKTASTGSTWRGRRTRGPGDDGRRCMREISMRENREVPCSPVADGATGRGGKAKAVTHR